MDVRPAYFALSFAPSLDFVSDVRRFVNVFYERALGPNQDEATKISLATHELLENAIQYCAEDLVTLRVSINPLTNCQIVNIRTQNRAKEIHAARLREIVRKIRANSDAESFYRQEMTAAVNRGDKESGLGLPRLYAEAGFDLSCEVRATEVTVCATLRVMEVAAVAPQTSAA